MIDGSDNNDISVTIATSQIVPEAVAEFQVLTNPYSVEFGRNSGGQINVITKSGTNRFHGEALGLLPGRATSTRSTNIEKSQRPHRTSPSSSATSLGGEHRRADLQGQDSSSSASTSATRSGRRHGPAHRRSRSRRRPASPRCRTCRSAPASRRRAARPCCSGSRSCRTSTRRTRLPEPHHDARERRRRSRPGRPTSTSSTPARTTRSWAASTIGSARATTSPCATRYNDRVDEQRGQQSASSARCSAGNQDLKDTNLAPATRTSSRRRC